MDGGTGAATPHLLLIFPGPVHEPAEYFGDRLERLSVYYRGTVLAAGPRPEVIALGRFQVTTLRQESGGKTKSFLALLQRAFSLAREKRRQSDPFDAVVTYDPLKSGVIGCCISRFGRVPLIVEVNGDYTATGNYADIANPMTQWMKRRLFILMERFVLHRAQGIKLLFPGQITAFESVLRNPVTRTFANYADLTSFRNLGETLEVLFVGHPYYLKGVDLLIAAFKSVSDEFPDWRLKILGWFPDRSELDAAIAGHPRITVHPPVYHREIAEHIGRCGIFVLPSRTEAMGRVLLEAMASGKPRIGSAVGGIPTVIRDGEDGLLFRLGDATHLAQALRRLMSDPDLRKRFGEDGARRVHEEFSPQAYVERIREFYDSVIEAAPARRRNSVLSRAAGG